MRAIGNYVSGDYFQPSVLNLTWRDLFWLALGRELRGGPFRIRAGFRARKVRR